MLLKSAILPVRFMVVVALLLFSNCQSDPDTIQPIEEPNPPKTLLLREYWEDGEVLLQYDYEEFQLTRQVFYERRGTLDYDVVYNNFNYKPNRMIADYGDRAYQMQFDYDSEGKVLGYTFFVERYIRYFIRLFYDEQGQIEKLHKYWPLNGVLETKLFEWEEGNIIRIEGYNNFWEESNPLVIEFTYDTKNNPFTALYDNLGFNVTEEIPLTMNNPITMDMHWKKSPNINETHNTKYAYDRSGYPFVKETQIKDTYGRKRTAYGEYKY